MIAERLPQCFERAFGDQVARVGEAHFPGESERRRPLAAHEGAVEPGEDLLRLGAKCAVAARFRRAGKGTNRLGAFVAVGEQIEPGIAPGMAGESRGRA